MEDSSRCSGMVDAEELSAGGDVVAVRASGGEDLVPDVVDTHLV